MLIMKYFCVTLTSLYSNFAYDLLITSKNFKEFMSENRTLKCKGQEYLGIKNYRTDGQTDGLTAVSILVIFFE